MTLIRTLLLTLALAMSVSACSVMRGQESMKEYTSDASITTAIKASYAKDSTVAATAIGVETLDGVVQLSGFAKSAEEKNRAETLAKQAKGVKTVRNDIINSFGSLGGMIGQAAGLLTSGAGFAVWSAVAKTGTTWPAAAVTLAT